MIVSSLDLNVITTNIVANVFGGLIVATILALSRRMIRRREPYQFIFPLPIEPPEKVDHEPKSRSSRLRRLFAGSIRFFRVPVLAFLAAKMVLAVFVLDIYRFNLLEYTSWLDKVIARLIRFSPLDFVLMLIWAIFLWWLISRRRTSQASET
jgi:hypothetical protein